MDKAKSAANAQPPLSLDSVRNWVQEQEKHLTEVVKQCGDGIAILDTHGTVLFSNQAFAGMHGYAPEEVIGQHVSIFHTPEQMEKVNAINQGMVESEFFSGEVWHVRRNGEEFPTWMQNSILTNDEGQAIGLIGTLRDTTALKHAENELKESKAFLESVFRAAPVGIGVVSNRVFLELNTRICELTGYSKEELLGQNARIVYSSDEDYEHVGRAKYAQIRALGTGTVETRWKRKDGSIFDVLLSSTPLDAENLNRGVTFTVLDISDLKRAQAGLERLGAAIEHAAEAVVVTDREGIILYVNPAFEIITGFSREEALGANIRILRSGKHDDAYYELLWDTILQGNVWSGRSLNKRKDGTFYHEEGSISPIFDAEGEVVNFVGIKRDISKEVELEAQLNHAQKLETLGTLAGGIAHDFNNILTPIIGYLEMAAEDLSSTHPVQVNLQQSLRGAKRASDLVKQILTFSGRASESTEPVLVQDIVDEVLQLARATLPSTIAIGKQFDAKTATVIANKAQLHQVVMNLLTNAKAAIGEKEGAIEIKLARVAVDANLAAQYLNLRTGDYLRLSVQDDGCGMEQDTLGKIFQPFFSTKDAASSSGLGLAVVHGIVMRLGGEITAESTSGEGTTVTVFLPEWEAEEVATQANPAEEIICGGTERILYVDDERSIAELAKNFLERLGYEVTASTDSTHALEVFRREPERFDLVITDQTMPHLIGTELAKRLIEIRADIPIILTSGFNEEPPVGSLQHVGIREFVMKPMRISDFGRTIRRILDESSSLEAG